MSYKLRSELTEKQIEADVAGYLGLITPPGEKRFRLLDVNEQVTGADKRFNLVIPLYMQFKVSQGLTALPSIIPVKDIPWLFPPLQRIRIFRKEKELFDNPTLYFKLREKAPTATDFQHNMLLRLAGTANSQAFYVAPLTLSDKDYNRMLQTSPEDLWSPPFLYSTNQIWRDRWYSHIGFVPFLRGHISIVPDETVSTANHYYAFSTTGTETSWHSPRVNNISATRLSDRLRTIFYSYLPSPTRWFQIFDFMQRIREDHQFSELVHRTGRNDNFVLNELFEFGQRLYDAYGIRQILILSNNDLF